MMSLSHFCIALDFGDCITEVSMSSDCPIYATHMLSGREAVLNLQSFNFRETLIMNRLTVP